MARPKLCNAAGTLKNINRPGPQQLGEETSIGCSEICKIQQQKAGEQQSKDILARQAGLEKFGLEQQEFSIKDHKALSNYAQEIASLAQDQASRENYQLWRVWTALAARAIQSCKEGKEGKHLGGRCQVLGAGA